MNRFADCILAEMAARDCSVAYLSDICGVSRNELGAVLSRRKKDIRLSTFLKICDSTDISVMDVFNIEDDEIFDRMISKCFLIHGRKKYAIKKEPRG